MRVFALITLVSLLNSAAYADLTVTFDNSITDIVLGIPDYSIDGGDMAGMLVTVTFSDNTTDSDFWSGTGNTGGAGPGSVSGWSLTQSGDTYSNDNDDRWVFANSTSKAIKGLMINAEVGAIVFDVIDSPEATQGSSFGDPFNAGSTDNSLTGTATYSRRIATTANHAGVPQNDLYGILTLSFTNGGGLAIGNTLRFFTDTDKLSSSIGAAVPEPSAFLFGGLVAGVIGCATGLRRLWAKQPSDG